MIKGLNHKCDASTWIFCSNFSAIIFCCTPLKVSEFMIALATIITIDGELAFTYTHKRKEKGIIIRIWSLLHKQNRAVLKLVYQCKHA